jgi:hypothetical protein
MDRLESPMTYNTKSDYTIDDIVEACIRRDIEREFDPGSIRFYLNMAYALGLGFKPTDIESRLAELDRMKNLRGISE